MPRNPLNTDGKTHDKSKGKYFLNQKKERILHLINPDGSVKEILLSIRESIPDGEGNYIDREIIQSPRDSAGNTLGPDPTETVISHTGLYIHSADQRALCTSIFHSPNLSRNVLIGQDGRVTQRGAICSRCDYWLNTTYIAAAVIIMEITIGLFIGTRFF